MNSSTRATLRRLILTLFFAVATAVLVPAVHAAPPTLANEEANQILTEFDGLMDEIVKAVKSKDEGKMKEVGAKTTALDKKLQELKLSDADKEKSDKYFEAFYKQVDAATK
jgi:Skp family chaperone for outer membrane proteins